LDRTVFAQAGLFALEVALFRLVEAWGVRPDFVVGHSIGEVAAAYVAGVFSLEDACALVAARGRLMQSAPVGGAMVSLQASEEEVLESLREGGWEGRVSLAAVNGPSAVVVSGDEDAVLEVAGVWGERGRKTRRLRVSHAFHSSHMDGVLGEFRGVVEGLSFGEPVVPVVSNLTGEVVGAGEVCSAEYWVRHVREPVRFMDGVRSLAGRGVRCFLELGPDGTLCAMGQECLAGVVEESVVAVPVLRRGRGEAAALLGSLAELWVRGVGVDWRGVFEGSGARRVVLPTYAFQRERFWLRSSSLGAGDVAAVGLAGADHPLLGAAVSLAGGEGWLFTGRVSLESHSWLGDHAVMGSVLFPGTAFLELALCAGGLVGCGVVRELTLEAPLVFAGEGGVVLQVVVGEDEGPGERSIGIYSRPERSDRDDPFSEGEEWTRHASGTLASAGTTVNGHAAATGERAELLKDDAWPPKDATVIDIEDLYDTLAEHGFEYGLVFQGLQAAWRRGDELLAEVALSSAEVREEAGAFGVHPALLDAAFHIGLSAAVGEGGRGDGDRNGDGQRDDVRLPFAFNGVELYAQGAPALRVLLSPGGDGAVSLLVADDAGQLVASIDSLSSREVSPSQLGAAARGASRESLFAIDWKGLPQPSGAQRATTAETLTATATGQSVVVLGAQDSPLIRSIRETGVVCEAYADLERLSEASLFDGDASRSGTVLFDCHPGGGDDGEPQAQGLPQPPPAMHLQAERVLALVQEWLANERFSGWRLALITRGAVAVDAEDEIGDLACSPVWGLVRSAESEDPGRLVLIDVDGTEDSWGALPAALSTDEAQLAIRRGGVLVPRLVRAARGPGDGVGDDRPVQTLDPEGTVLVTGGTGVLGGLVARHLVVEHGVRRLLLVGRRGAGAEGVGELRAELESLGAVVDVRACDVSMRAELEELLGSLDAGHPLRGVVHAAGVLDDGVIGSLTAERLRGVMASKADAAWYLHELTEGMDLSMFVLFSSAAGVFGSPGQGSYAAANAFLDGLASYRRARGLPGISLAWGLWEQAGGMAGGLSEGDLARMARSGLRALSEEEGLRLLDAALGVGEPLLLPMPLEPAALRAQAKAGVLPALLSDLVSAPARRPSDTRDGSLARRLAAAPEQERESVVLELVRAQVAAVLGYTSPETIDVLDTFKELGFDSLTAVELRNRLNTTTGLRLPPALVFDYPTPRALADYLLGEVTAGEVAAGANAAVAAMAELNKLEHILTSLASEDSERAGIVRRLRALVSSVTANGAATDEDDLDATTVDEVLEAMDEEFESL
jgi:acyl transferase domain-containing protein/acyl carrier protein